MMLFLSADYRHNQKNLYKPKRSLSCRSYSHEQILHNPNSHRSNSNLSVDLFTLVIPTNTDSSLSSLICSICSLPMMKPTILPCQHTFCFKCIQNNQQIRVGSVPLHSNNCLISNHNHTRIITCQKCSRIHRINSLTDLESNQSMELLINTLLCETCHQLYPSNQLDTCFHCFNVLCTKCYDDHIQNHQNDLETNKKLYRIISTDETINISMNTKTINKDQSSDFQIFKPKSINTDKQPKIESTSQIVEVKSNEDTNNTKKKSNNPILKMFKPSRHRQHTSSSMKEPTHPTSSSPVKQTSSAKLSRRSKLVIDIKPEGTSDIETLPTAVPVTPVRRFKNLSEQYAHTAQHVKQCKQRQLELDQAVNKLIEVLTSKTDENINQISQYWMHLKQLSLDQLESKTNRFPIFDYLLKTCCSSFDNRKQIESYLAQNDEIKATLQVLSTTLVIVKDQQSIFTINQLFHREEQTIVRTLRRQLESLLSVYSEELSFIIERIRVYESRFSAWKNSNPIDLDSIAYEWSQIVEHDYPSLVEKISNDFVTKIPQIEKVLVQMLKNMKKRLLNVDNQITNRRTSD